MHTTILNDTLFLIFQDVYVVSAGQIVFSTYGVKQIASFVFQGF